LLSLELIHHTNVVKLSQLPLEGFIKTLHHHPKPVEDGPVANHMLYVLEYLHHQLVNLLLFVQTQRVGIVFSLVHQAVLSLSLEVPHLDILLQRSRLVHR
jgi:hypothetical protein